MREVGKKDKQSTRPGERSRQRVAIFVLLLLALTVTIFIVRERRSASFVDEFANSTDAVQLGGQKREVGRRGRDGEGDVPRVSESEPARVTGISDTRLRFSVEEFTRGVLSADVVVRNKWLEEFKRRLVVADSQGQDLRELGEFLREISAESDAFAPLVAAAGAVGTPAVQKVLSQLLAERPNDWRTFAAIVPVLGGLSAPTDQTIDVLVRLARDADGDFSSTAALALGATVHTLGTTQPERGQRLLQSFISRLENPSEDVESLKEGLAVVGNAGLASTAPVLLRLTKHRRADVRADAVMALRFIRTSEVERRFLELIETDPDLDVRLRVVDAWIHAPVTVDVIPVVQRLLESTSKNPLLFREKCIDLLMHLELNSVSKNQLREWLVALAAREDNARLRAKLQSAAAALSGQ